MTPSWVYPFIAFVVTIIIGFIAIDIINRRKDKGKK